VYTHVCMVSGVSSVSAGLIVSARRPERWTGALMIGAGFALFAETLVEADRSLPFTLGLGTLGLPAAVLAHLVLVFPDGRLHSNWERLVVGAAYLNAIVVQVLMLMVMPLEQVGGCPCPRNLLFFRHGLALQIKLMSVERQMGIAVAAAVTLILVLRWLQ